MGSVEYNPPIGRKNTTCIPLIVLAEPGGWKMLPIPPFRGTSIPTIDFSFPRFFGCYKLSLKPKPPTSVLKPPETSGKHRNQGPRCWDVRKFKSCLIYIWMFPKIGGETPKWMVYDGKPYEQMDDLGVPLFLETPIYLYILVLWTCVFFSKKISDHQVDYSNYIKPNMLSFVVCLLVGYEQLGFNTTMMTA